MNRKMNKKIYLGIYVVSLTLALLAVILAIAFFATRENFPALRRDFQPIEPFVLFIVGLGVLQFLVVYIVYPFVLLTKMWSAIQDGNARTTPGKAVGFLFIPFFNIYWICNVWGGFPTDYNNFVGRYQLPVSNLSPMLFIMFPVFVLISGITFGATLIVNFFILLAIIPKVCDAVNAVAEATQERRTVVPVQTQNPAMAIV